MFLCVCVCMCIRRNQSDDNNNNTRKSTKRVELAGEKTHESAVWNVSITALKSSRFLNTKSRPAGKNEIRYSSYSPDHTSTLFFFGTLYGSRDYHKEGYERRRDTLYDEIKEKLRLWKRIQSILGSDKTIEEKEGKWLKYMTRIVNDMNKEEYEDVKELSYKHRERHRKLQQI